MKKLTEKEIISLLESLVNSGDLRLKVNIKEDSHEYAASAFLTYKDRKIFSVNNNKVRHQ